MGIALAPHFAGPMAKTLARRAMEQWLGCQEAVQWSQCSSAFAKCTMHFMRVCLWCQRATPLRSGFCAGCWGPLSWIQNCLAAVPCTTHTSVSSPVCHKWQLCYLWPVRIPEGLISANGVNHGSWIYLCSVKICDSGKTWPKIVRFLGLYPVKVRRFRGTSSSG